MNTFISQLEILGKSLDGDLKHDIITTTIYSTDASVYKEEPVAVIWPKDASDIKKTLQFASKEKTSITFRAGGTSLAGQVVSSGIIVDISRYMNKIKNTVCFLDMRHQLQTGAILEEWLATTHVAHILLFTALPVIIQ
jgi:FAD/FMN-containing dehydrogenase